MSDLDKIIPGDKKEGSTVEVIVKNEHANEETEIDLVRVFENMGRKRRIYAWVMIVCMLIGIAAPLLMAELSEKTASASAVISFLYPGASRQLAPDGTELDMNTIVSSYVLRNALNKTKLSEYVPINAVENNISIENLLSADTRQKLEVMEKIADEGKNYEEVLNLDYTYDGRYIITLKNGFSADPESRNKTYLNGNELTELLNNIISAYNQYFYDTYPLFPESTMQRAQVNQQQLRRLLRQETPSHLALLLRTHPVRSYPDESLPNCLSQFSPGSSHKIYIYAPYSYMTIRRLRFLK